MGPRRLTLGLVTLGLLLGVSAATAQEVRTVDNPYQEELAYEVNSVLQPQVMINGLRWSQFKIEPRQGKDLVNGEEIPVTVILELENHGESTAEVLAVFLLENERGAQLARLECKSMRIRADRIEEEKTKLKVDGGALRDTRKVWVFLEVTR